jgi:hypothetical protein
MTEENNALLEMAANQRSDVDDHMAGHDRNDDQTVLDILKSRTDSIKSANIQSLRDDGIMFKEHYVDLSKMTARQTEGYKKEHGAGSSNNLLKTAIEFNDDVYFPTTRFWVSLCAKAGISPSVFNLFTHEEVFKRCVNLDKISGTGRVRIVEDVRNNSLLAITDPSKSIMHWDNVMKILESKGAVGTFYDGSGIITSTHVLQNEVPILIGHEDFKQRICVRTPIDGYGSPAVYLSLLREVCANGMVAMAKAFKTVVKTGKKSRSNKNDPVEFSLERMFDSYSNDEGFDALIRRIDFARRSKMSVREFHNAQKILCNLKVRDPSDKEGLDKLIRPEARIFSRLAGDLHVKYGLAHLQEMTDRQMGLLETDLTMYEGFNFLSEIASHVLDMKDKTEALISTKIQAWIGGKLTKSYDLEGTVDEDDVKDNFRNLYFGSGVNRN